MQPLAWLMQAHHQGESGPPQEPAPEIPMEGKIMRSILKTAAAGGLALAMAVSGVASRPAEAHGPGPGLFFGLATGLIVGGIIASEANRHHSRVYLNSGYDYDQGPSCYLGPRECRWEQVCQPGGYGETFCQKVRHCFRQQYCN